MQLHDGMSCHNDDGLSVRVLMTSLGEGKDRSFNTITGNPVSRYFIEWPIFPSQDVSNAGMSLGTVLATIPVLFMTVRAGTAYQHLFPCCRYRCTDVQII